METRMSGFEELKAVRHSARVEGWDVGWEEMPKPLGAQSMTDSFLSELIDRLAFTKGANHECTT